jgi:hypothetical protein
VGRRLWKTSVFRNPPTPKTTAKKNLSYEKRKTKPGTEHPDAQQR